MNERLVVEQHANIGISPRGPPNQWEYWPHMQDPYHSHWNLDLEWYGSRYGWLGVPVFFSGSLEFYAENMMCWV